MVQSLLRSGRCGERGEIRSTASLLFAITNDSFRAPPCSLQEYDPVKVRQKGKGGANATKFLNEKAKGGTKLLPTDREKAKKVVATENPEKKQPTGSQRQVLKEAGNVPDKTATSQAPTKVAVKKAAERGVRRTQSAKGRMGLGERWRRDRKIWGPELTSLFCSLSSS